MSQGSKILDYLQAHKGEWVSSKEFIRGMWISQTAARIVELKNKGHVIQYSDDFGIPRDEYGYASYRLVEEPQTVPMI